MVCDILDLHFHFWVFFLNFFAILESGIFFIILYKAMDSFFDQFEFGRFYQGSLMEDLEGIKPGQV